MADLSISSATTTNFSNVVPDFIVNAIALDAASPNQEETYWYFSNATERYGYYLTIPEIYSGANAMATWAFGAGYTVVDRAGMPIIGSEMAAILEHVRGMGKDSFSRMIWNHEVVKLIVGDSFIEIKRKDGKIINMIPISPERVRVVFNKEGMIKRYDTWNGKEWRAIAKEDMLHSQNKRIGDQLHGTSQIEAIKFSIDARNEALSDERLIKHRDKALGIVYYKTDNAGKIAYANSQIEKGVKNGEMIGLPEGTAEIKAYPSKSSEDRTAWISYLENFIYQNLGVPRSIVTSDGTSEVGGKMGNVNFEPTYAKERMDMEDDLWLQAGISIKFEKQASLGGLVQQDQAKNTGMTSIQPNDVAATMTRE